jgi:CHAT domain-containing protein
MKHPQIAIQLYRCAGLVGVVLIVSLSVKISQSASPSLSPQAKTDSSARSASEPAPRTTTQGSDVTAEVNLAEAERLRAEQKEQSNRLAISKYQQAADLWRSAGQPEKAASALRITGELSQILGDTHHALLKYEESLTLSRKCKSQREEGRTLNDLAYLQFYAGDNAAALRNSLAARKLGVALNDRAIIAQALSNIGETYSSLGDLTKAKEYQQQALIIWRELGDQRGQSQAATALGYCYANLDESTRAIESYNEAISSARAAHDLRSESLALIALGNLKSKLGDKQAALDSYAAAKVLTEQVGAKTPQAMAFGGMGYMYFGLGDMQKALEYVEQAEKLFALGDEKWGVAEMEMDLGMVHHSLGNAEKALNYFQQSLSVFRSLSMQRYQSQLLRDIGLVYSSINDKKSALDSFEQALRLTRKGQDHRQSAYTLNYIGEVYDDLHNYQKAFQYFRQALALNRLAADPAGEVLTLYNLAHTDRNSGNLTDAQQRIDRAVGIAESLRTRVSSQDLRASYFATVRRTYELYIDILMQQQRTSPNQDYVARAFQISERARARSFLESLQESQADIRQGVDPELLAQMRSVEAELNAKADRQMKLLQNNDKPEAEKTAKELEQLTGKYSELRDQIKATSPRFAELTLPQPLTLDQVQERILDDHTLLLEYALGDDRSYVWVVSKTGVSGHELPPRSEIEAAATRLYKLFTAFQPVPGESLEQRLQRQAAAGRSVPSESSLLSKLTLGPLAGSLGNKRLLIIPDGALQYIPFQVLTDPNINSKMLLDSHEIVNEPSASTLGLLLAESMVRTSSPDTVAVLADPVFDLDDPRLGHGSKQTPSPTDERLKLQQALRDIGISADGVEIPRLFASGEEAEEIIATVPWGSGLKAIGFEATRERVLGPDLARYRIVHFATHGLINNQHPELSGIVLSLFDREGNSRDGFLRLHDIYNLHLPADLVVLSACSTGLGKDVKGEGLIGLTRGFMYAGASGVVASLWKVDDDATAVLMKGFYEAMFKKGLSPAAALRDSQLAMAQQEKWRAPYYWAGFIIQGETDAKQFGRSKFFLTRGRLVALVILAAGLAAGASMFGLRRRRYKVV